MDEQLATIEEVIDFTADEETSEATGGKDEGEREAAQDLLERLRLALLASDPVIAPELVRGDTADELEASFAAAQRLVAGMREAVIRERATAIPAGAPGRVAAGPVSAYEKIRAGLGRL